MRCTILDVGGSAITKSAEMVGDGRKKVAGRLKDNPR
jgi:hypothetical protein